MKETPSQLNIPSYVMNFPFTLDTKNPNNIWMKELTPDDLKVNKKKAYKQFLDLYKHSNHQVPFEYINYNIL
jgi:hypothetical protein